MDPIDLLGVLFVAIGCIASFIVGIKLALIYKRSKKNQTIFLSLLLLNVGASLLFLMIEQSLLLFLVDPETAAIPPLKSIIDYSAADINIFWVAYILACIAYIASVVAIMASNAFIWSFYDWSKKVLIFPAIILIIYLLILIFSPFEFKYIQGDWTPERDPTIDLITLILVILPLFAPVFLFLYLTFSIRRQGRAQWRRLFVLMVGQLLLTIGYIVEIINVDNPFISMLSRFGIMIYPFVIYIGFLTPERFKKVLGLSR